MEDERNKIKEPFSPDQTPEPPQIKEPTTPDQREKQQRPTVENRKNNNPEDKEEKKETSSRSDKQLGDETEISDETTI